jgi:anhydro-N-acetylmuramic acid kinase
LRLRLHSAASGVVTAWEVAQLHHDLGRFYVRGALRQRSSGRVQLVGLHGQTVFHRPHRHAPATLQLGEPAYLAEALRVPVVANFRAADLAAGGQGAPLAAVFHVRAFARRGEHVCVNNLGGISNVTSLDWRRGGRAPRVLAFDTGPANVLLDLAAREFTSGRKTFDRNGAWAKRGRVDAALLARWLRHPYFKLPPPKSTGRELFGEPFWREHARELRRLTHEDALATLVEFTARSVALNYQRHLPSIPDRVILCGGGAANPTLVRALERALQALRGDCEVTGCDVLGWPVQSVEPAAFALLAWLRANGMPGNLPATTGARRAVQCGQMVGGK